MPTSRTRVVRLCLTTLLVSGALLSASVSAQSASTTPEILDSTAAFPNQWRRETRRPNDSTSAATGARAKSMGSR